MQYEISYDNMYNIHILIHVTLHVLICINTLYVMHLYNHICIQVYVM